MRIHYSNQVTVSVNKESDHLCIFSVLIVFSQILNIIASKKLFNMFF